MDDVMFSHNGANRPEPTTTRMFRPVRQVAAPGANSAVSDCILSFLTLRNVGWPGLPEPTKSSSYHSRTVMVIPFSPFSNGRFILGDPAFSYVFAQVDLPLKTFSMETPCNSMWNAHWNFHGKLSPGNSTCEKTYKKSTETRRSFVRSLLRAYSLHWTPCSAETLCWSNAPAQQRKGIDWCMQMYAWRVGWRRVKYEWTACQVISITRPLGVAYCLAKTRLTLMQRQLCLALISACQWTCHTYLLRLTSARLIPRRC